MFLNMGGNIQNDIIDMESDKISHFNRPIAAGRLNTRTAGRAVYGFYVCGLAFSLVVSPSHAILAALIITLLWFYNHYLQGMPLVGNGVVSLLCGLSVYYPEWPRFMHHTFPPFIFVILSTMAREIIKDIQDEKSDKKVGHNTLPILIGKVTSRKFAVVFLLLTFLMLPVPVVFWEYHISFGIIATLFVAVPLFYTIRLLYATSPQWEKAQKMIKILMLGGIAAIIGGKAF
jgi:4-hydroxybenzoate polyprenyltransferase